MGEGTAGVVNDVAPISGVGVAGGEDPDPATGVAAVGCCGDGSGNVADAGIISEGAFA
jgi:hypothetical protein